MGYEAIEPENIPQGILYVLATIIMALVGFLIREVIKRLDKQINLAEATEKRYATMDTRLEQLLKAQELTAHTVSTLTETVRNIVEVQNTHLQLTRDQIELTKRWHDKVDRSWNPNLPPHGDQS